MRSLFLLLVVCLVTASLAGCGQKGPLVRRPASTTPTNAVTPPSTAPASASSAAAPGTDAY